MKKIIKNRLFRILGVLIILYYGLFYKNNHPDSLRKRLELEKVKSDLHDISIKSSNIIWSVKKAEEIKKLYIYKNEKDQKKTNLEAKDEEK